MARRCIEKKIVARQDGGQQTVCARYETTDDALVMARSHDDEEKIGALDLEIIRGLDFSAEAIVPPVLGIGAAAAAALLIRKYVSNPTVVKYAHLLGGVAAIVAAIPIKMWKGDKAMQNAAVAGLLYGVVNQGIEYVKTTPWGAGMGMLVTQRMPIGALPAYIPDNTNYLPKSVRSSVDASAYGAATV
jgi:hypothetical protein